MTDKTTVQYCVACGQVKPLDDYWWRKINYWQELAIANRKVAEDNQTRLAAVTKRRDECSNGWDEALAQRDKAVADADHFFACWQDTLEQRDKLAVALKWLDAAGNLGLDKHARIREALKECGK